MQDNLFKRRDNLHDTGSQFWGFGGRGKEGVGGTHLYVSILAA